MGDRPKTTNELRDANDPILTGTVKAYDMGVDSNPDLLTGEPGSHPVGAGLGAAAAGMLAGIAMGAAAGPIGATVGAVVGGIAGGFAGKSMAEAIEPTAESEYWKQEYPRRDYFRDGITYDDIQPAYRYGWEARTRFPHKSWEEAHEDLRREWESKQTDMPLATWEDAQRPIRDAWDRVEERIRAGGSTVATNRNTERNLNA